MNESAKKYLDEYLRDDNFDNQTYQTAPGVTEQGRKIGHSVLMPITEAGDMPKRVVVYQPIVDPSLGRVING